MNVQDSIESPEDLIEGKKYSVLVARGQRTMRIAGTFLRMESKFDYSDSCKPKRATLFIALQRRMDVEYIPWAESFDWQEVPEKKKGK